MLIALGSLAESAGFKSNALVGKEVGRGSAEHWPELHPRVARHECLLTVAQILSWLTSATTWDYELADKRGGGLHPVQ